jgi:hypothetical protein
MTDSDLAPGVGPEAQNLDLGTLDLSINCAEIYAAFRIPKMGMYADLGVSPPPPGSLESSS